MGWARVGVRPRAAKILVSGVEVPARRTLGLSAGKHKVQIEAEGYTGLRAQIAVLAGQAAVVSFELERAPEPKLVRADPQPSPATPASPTPVTTDKAEPAGGPGTRQWVLAGTGAAMLGGGVGMHLWSFSAAKDGEKYQSPVDGLTRDERKDLYNEAADRASTRQTVAYVLYGAGAAAIVTAIILWDSGEAADETAFHILPALLPDGAGISLRGGLW